MGIIALDLSPNNTGFMIFGGESSILHYGTLSPPPSLSRAKRIFYTKEILRVMCEVFNVREAAIEDYAYHLRSSATTFLREQGGAVKQMLLEKEVKVYKYNISVIKKFATGFGGASKSEMAAVLGDISDDEKLQLFKRASRLRRKLTSDEVDAFFIGRLHYDNVRRRLLGEQEWEFELEN